MKTVQENKSKLFSVRYLFYDFVKLTAAVPGLLWFRLKTIYVSKTAKRKIRGGALLISNHVGFSDPVVLQLCVWYRRHHFICIKQLFEGRFTRLLFTGFLCIPIDRENFSMNSFREITQRLQDGELVTMFPEGHVNGVSEGIAAFKSGMVLMAVKSGRPIVPVFIERRKHWYNRVRMAIGEPLETAALLGKRPTMTQIEEITQMLYQKEEELKTICNLQEESV